MSEMPRDPEEAFNVLGRIVGDRAAALMIFGNETPATRSTVSNLSTERDIVQDASDDAFAKVFNKRACPFAPQ